MSKVDVVSAAVSITGVFPDRPPAHVIRMVISRDNVQRGNVGPDVDRLMALVDTRTSTMAYHDSLVLFFEGFDDGKGMDSVTSPLCRRYMADMTDQFPYWLHFSEPSGREMSRILRKLIDKNGSQAGAHMTKMFDAMNTLHRSYGLPQHQTDDATRKMIRGMAMLRAESRL